MALDHANRISYIKITPEGSIAVFHPKGLEAWDISSGYFQGESAKVRIRHSQIYRKCDPLGM
jgi:hypothetical protein